MTTGVLDFDEASILQRLDRSSADALLKSLVMELARLGHAHALLQARLVAMESLQAMADRIAAGEGVEAYGAFPSRVSVTAENSNLGAHGFHRLEHDAAGMPFRWSGPDPEFSFQVFIDRRKSAQFTLKIARIYADVPVEGLQCYVDGEPTEMAFVRESDGYEASGVMPPRKDPGGSVLTFICPKMEAPVSRGIADTRSLGVLFRSLTIEPGSVTGKRLDASRGPKLEPDRKPLLAAAAQVMTPVSSDNAVAVARSDQSVAQAVGGVSSRLSDQAPEAATVEVMGKVGVSAVATAPGSDELEAEGLSLSAKLGQ